MIVDGGNLQLTDYGFKHRVFELWGNDWAIWVLELDHAINLGPSILYFEYCLWN